MKLSFIGQGNLLISIIIQVQLSQRSDQRFAGIKEDAHFNNRSIPVKHLHFNPNAVLRKEKLISHLGVQKKTIPRIYFTKNF